MLTSTQQELFDTIVAHLRKQNAQSIATTTYGTKDCFYRSPEGLQCAVGCLIKSDYYAPHLEGSTPDDPDVRRALSKSLDRNLSKAELNLLCNMQYLHDEFGPEEWEDQFTLVAKIFNLTVPEKSA